MHPDTLAAQPSEYPNPAAAQWISAGRALVVKMLAEFSYEEVLHPIEDGDGYRLELPGGSVYRFRARRGCFGSWRIDPDSVSVAHGRDTAIPATDPQQLLCEVGAVLGLSGPVVCDALRDLLATQAADTRLLRDALPAAAMAELAYHDLESYQTGHPVLILNKGRLGFATRDSAQYTPEARQPVQLSWIAVHQELAVFAAVDGLTMRTLLEEELGAEQVARFRRELADRLRASGNRSATESYVWLPVHPWHWDEVVQPLFAPYLADGRMIPLGTAPDRYRPLQSIRTLTDIDHPHRRNTKLALLIRNTLVWRGIAAEPTRAAPEITAWIHQIRAKDPYLHTETGIIALGEVASVAVTHPLFEQVPGAPYRYRDQLGVVWREPISAYLRPGERPRTMAALLYEGPAGDALVAEFVARSGLSARDWLRRFFHALLPGLLHYLYRYGLCFCPHGENTVIIYDDHDVPIRIAVKDFAEDINLLTDDLPEYQDLPPAADAVLHRWQPKDLLHSIQSAIFTGHFRFFADITERHLAVPEDEFWELVRAEILDYQARFPELSDRFALFDLFTPAFERIALNREQLLALGNDDRAERDDAFDLSHGEVTNPLYRCE